MQRDIECVSIGEISATKDRVASGMNRDKLRFLSIEPDNSDIPTAVTHGASI